MASKWKFPEYGNVSGYEPYNFYIRFSKNPNSGLRKAEVYLMSGDDNYEEKFFESTLVARYEDLNKDIVVPEEVIAKFVGFTGATERYELRNYTVFLHREEGPFTCSEQDGVFYIRDKNDSTVFKHHNGKVIRQLMEKLM